MTEENVKSSEILRYPLASFRFVKSSQMETYPGFVSTMKCSWPVRGSASRRQVFEKGTRLSFSRAFAVPDCILRIIEISGLSKTKESCFSRRFLSVTKTR
jgi:hypothetical protein